MRPVCPLCRATYEDGALTNCPQDGLPLQDKIDVTDAAIGTVLAGDYVVVSKLGQGGMAQVYSAFQRSLKRMAAVKLVAEADLVDPSFIKRFDREAEAVSRLRHPNVVTVFDYGRTADAVRWLSMELLEGRTLHETLAYEGALAHPRALRIFEQVLRGLAAAHDAEMLHRDLKPGNIFLCKAAGLHEHVKVFDFGLVWLVNKTEDPRLTHVGWVVGTEGYMSPEQRIGAPCDARSDLYAAGVLLREMLTGWSGIPYKQDGSKAPLEAPAGLPAIPEKIRGLVDALTAPDPDDRPATARMVLDLIGSKEAPSGGPPTVNDRARAAPSTLVAPGDSEAELRAALEAPPERPAPSRGRWIAALVALVVVVAGLTQWPQDDAPAMGAQAHPAPKTKTKNVVPDIVNTEASDSAPVSAGTSDSNETAPVEDLENLVAVKSVAVPPANTVEMSVDVPVVDDAVVLTQPVDPAPPPRVVRSTPKRVKKSRSVRSCPGGRVKITSFPPGAKVRVARSHAGATPLAVKLPPKRTKIVVAKGGYETRSVRIGAKQCSVNVNLKLADPTRGTIRDPTGG